MAATCRDWLFHKGNSGPMLVRKCPPKLYLFLSIQISSAAFPRSICGVNPGNIAGSILATCHGRCVAPQIQIFWHLMVLLVAICGNHQRQLHFVYLCSAPCFAGRSPQEWCLSHKVHVAIRSVACMCGLPTSRSRSRLWLLHRSTGIVGIQFAFFAIFYFFNRNSSWTYLSAPLLTCLAGRTSTT